MNFDTFLTQERKKIKSVNSKIADHLLTTYGTRYNDIIQLVEENPSLGKTICSSSPIIKAEVVYAVRNEMAQKLSDVVLRRTELGSGEFPGNDCLRQCASIMAKELSWSNSRIKTEVGEIKKHYNWQT